MSVICVFVSFLEFSWLVFSELFDLKKKKKKREKKKPKSVLNGDGWRPLAGVYTRFQSIIELMSEV